MDSNDKLMEVLQQQLCDMEKQYEVLQEQKNISQVCELRYKMKQLKEKIRLLQRHHVPA